MTTNEILFWALVILTWVLSLLLAYIGGKIVAFEQARKIAHEVVREKFKELKKQPPIR